MALVLQFPQSVQKASDILHEIMNDSKKAKPGQRSKPRSTETDPFASKSTIAIKVHEYVDRIVRYTGIEESTLIVALIYIDRLCCYGNYKINEKNIHRVILVALISAVKYNEDDIYANSFYAKVGGVTEKELYALESEFFKMIKFRFFIKEDVFLQYRAYLKQYKQDRY
jgi:hypothetical protein